MKKTAAMFAIMTGLLTAAQAQPPALLHYQGRLVDGTNLVNGPVNLMFRLHDHPTNKSILFESTNLAVAVDGLYATTIGEYVIDGNLDTALAAPEIWLEVFVNGFELDPRERLAAVPYARRVPGFDVRGALTVVGNADFGMHDVHSNAVRSVIGGGFQHQLEQVQQATISGGRGNRILAGADSSAIGGGFSNTVSAAGGVVPGGDRNEAGLLAFAAGRRAKATHDGSFVWGDSTDADVASTANDQVTFRAGGGLRVIGGSISGDASGLSNFPSVLLINRATGGDGRIALHTNHVVDADWSSILGGQDQEIGIGATHAVIVGGKDHTVAPAAAFAVISGGSNNVVEGQAGTVAGGANNRALGTGSVVSGGDGNRAQSPYATVAGGQYNRTTGSWSTVSGGFINNALEWYSVVGGGNENTAAGFQSTVSGGAYNNAEANGVAIGGGVQNTASSLQASIGGGLINVVQTNADYATISGGRNNVVNDGSFASAVGGGWANVVQAHSPYSVIAGGFINTIAATNAVIGGGRENAILSESGWSVIDGGRDNIISNAYYSAIGGGRINRIAANSDYATVVGGYANDIQSAALATTIGGGWQNRIWANSFYSLIGGGSANTVFSNSPHAVIGGGYLNIVNGDAATVAGGRGNRSFSAYSFVGGGYSNFNYSVGGTIGGGQHNGTENTGAAVVGGRDNVAAGNFSFIGGGSSNQTGSSGGFSVVPGGQFNTAEGYTSFAAGRRAKALHDGSFVWGDMTFADVTSTLEDQVTFRASGGYRLFSNGAMTLGAQLLPNQTAWSVISDRNAKENFEAIDTAAILSKVADLPVTAWTYKDDPDQRRYIGPVAQDFHTAFGLGNDTTINTLDMDGVLVAAVKALAEENAKLREELDAIKRHLGL